MKKSIVYTRTGDAGTTSLVGGERAPKNAPRLEAYGTIDELNSHIGLLVAQTQQSDVAEMLTWIQHRLFNIGGYLACNPDGGFTMPPGADDDSVAKLERMIDDIDSRLPKIKCFVLPGGTVFAAEAHVARTVCRRAERLIVTLSQECEVDAAVMCFVNRLSDFLFVLARFNNVVNGVDEIFWQKDC